MLDIFSPKITEIAKGDPLPDNLRIVAGSTLEQGITNLFEAITTSPVNAAIWCDCESLLPPETWHFISLWSEEADAKAFGKGSSDDLRRDISALDSHPDMKTFAGFLADIPRIFENISNTHLRSYGFVSADYKRTRDNWHLDKETTPSHRLLITTHGPTTLLAANEDVEFFKAGDRYDRAAFKDRESATVFCPPARSLLAISNRSWAYPPIYHSRPYTGETPVRRSGALYDFKPNDFSPS